MKKNRFLKQISAIVLALALAVTGIPSTMLGGGAVKAAGSDQIVSYNGQSYELSAGDTLPTDLTWKSTPLRAGIRS